MINDIKSQLVRDEGVVLHAYQDHLGFTTIGVGRLIDKRRGGGISEDEAMYLLDNDIKRRAEDLVRLFQWTNTLDDARFGVLLNMSFQLGISGLAAFKKTLSLIESGHYDQAAIEMLDSKWAIQTPGRANRLSQQMESGEWV